MEAIVAAAAAGQNAIQPGASAGSKPANGAEGQFGLLMQEKLSGPAQGAQKSPKDAADSMAMLAALMQYGALFNLAPAQGLDTQGLDTQGLGTQSADAPAQPAGSAAQTLPQAPMMASPQAAAVLAAAQALEGTAGQAADAVLGTASQSYNSQPQIKVQENPVIDAQSAMALGEIRQLFAELIAEAPQDGSAPKAADTLNADISAPRAAASAVPGQKAGDPLLQALSDALETAGNPGASEGKAEGETLASDSGEKPGKGANFAGFLGKEPAAAAFRAETADAGKAKQASFDTQLSSARGQVLPPQTLSAPASKPAAAQAKAPERAFDSLVERITSMQNSGLKQMEISLKPDSLGKIVIKLTMGSDGLVAKIAASNPKVQDAFVNSASTLQNSLAQQGLKDVRVVVTSTGVQDAAMQQNSDGQRRQQGQEKRRNPVIVQAQGLSAAGEPLLAYEQPAKAGSVNCLA